MATAVEEGLSEKEPIGESLDNEFKRNSKNQSPGKPSKQKVKKDGKTFIIG